MQYQRKKEVTKHTLTLTSPPPSLRIQEGSLAIEPRVDSMGSKECARGVPPSPQRPVSTAIALRSPFRCSDIHSISD